MQTLDCFRSGNGGELTLICTGMDNAPIVIDLETGASATMHPVWAHTELARFGIASVSDAPHSHLRPHRGSPCTRDRRRRAERHCALAEAEAKLSGARATSSPSIATAGDHVRGPQVAMIETPAPVTPTTGRPAGGCVR